MSSNGKRTPIPALVQSVRTIGGVIGSLMETYGLAESYHGWRIVRDWPRIAGDAIASAAQAWKYENGTLFVSCPLSAWRQTMHFKLPELLAAIHHEPGGTVIRQIVLVQERPNGQMERTTNG